ncbi:hypothetical protein BC833DRAFT_619462 [Globomyces pollinis-pini]|nr:hypothetical protein BC833DRAFT_619462 [Globomyces pollinis-pini]
MSNTFGSSDTAEEDQIRRNQQLKLAMETIDLSKDPYIMKNKYGTFDCRLCQTTHTTEESYLAHTQAKKHSTNLAKRAMWYDLKEQKQAKWGRPSKNSPSSLPTPSLTAKRITAAKPAKAPFGYIEYAGAAKVVSKKKKK